MNLTKNVKVTRVMSAVAAGTTDQNSSEVDMKGFEGVMFIAAFGTIDPTAVTSVKAQQDTVTGMAGAADLEGSSISVAADDDDLVVVLDIYRPQERFVRCVIDRGTANAVIDGVIAIQYGPRKKPTTHDATTVVGTEVHASPDEGTA